MKKQKALTISIFSALTVGLVHYIAHHTFNHTALMGSNIQLVGITVVVAVFLISYIGMKMVKE